MTKVSFDTNIITIRPTHKELTKKIKGAVQAVSEGRIRILNPEVIARDALELGYRVSDLPEFLLDALSTLSPGDYIGHLPPEKSYVEQLKGADLFAFEAFSQRIGCSFYLKFALIEKCLWIVSLHEYEEQGGKR